VEEEREGASIGLYISVLTFSMSNTANVRATGHKIPGESSVNITVSVYDTTHLQENPQRIG